MWMSRFARWVLAHPRVILGFLAALTLGLGAAATQLRVDSSVEGMLPNNDPDLAFYRTLVERFGSDELVIIGLDVSRLFERPALATIQRISQGLVDMRLEQDPNHPNPTYLIDRVVSLSEVDQIRGAREPDGSSTFTVKPFLSHLPESKAESDALFSEAVTDPLFLDNFISRPTSDDPDAAFTTLILARIVDRPGDLTYRFYIQEQVEAILEREINDSAEIRHVYVAGAPIMKATLAKMAQKEMAKLTPLSWAVILVMLFWVFRSGLAVWMPIVPIFVAYIWTIGFLTLCGSSLNVASVTILPLVQVIGAPTTIYFFSEYYSLARNGRASPETLLETLDGVMLPSFLAALTTAAGFLALAASPISLIQEVGMYSAFGVMSVWLIAVTLLPVLLLRRKKAVVIPEQAVVASRGMISLADRLSEITERYRWPIALTGLLVMGTAAYGVTQIRTTTDIVRFLEASHPLPQAYYHLEDQIGGIRSFDIVVRAGPRDLLEPEHLGKLAQLQDWIGEQPEVDHTFSIVDYLRRIHQAMHEDDPAYFRLPDTQGQVASYLMLFEDPVDSRIAPFLYPNWEQVEEARIAVRSKNLDSGEVAALITRFTNYIREHRLSDPTLEIDVAAGSAGSLSVFAGERIRSALRSFFASPAQAAVWPDTLANGQMGIRVTGATLLYANMANGVVEGQIKSLFLAFSVVGLALIFLLRSVRTALLAMIPNVFPILLMLGIMGFAGIRLDLANAMISAIAMGIAVDDTVHFLTRYRRRRIELGNEREAVRATLREIGRPMIFTSVVLALGFWVVCFSAFEPHFYFALLAGLTMLAALLGDLVLLPALLFIFKPRMGGSTA